MTKILLITCIIDLLITLAILFENGALKHELSNCRIKINYLKGQKDWMTFERDMYYNILKDTLKKYVFTNIGDKNAQKN